MPKLFSGMLCMTNTCLLVEHTFGEQFLEGVPGQGATDLQPFRNNSRCDELVVRDLLVQLLICGLVEEDQVVQLIPDLPLGPLLLRCRQKDSVRNIRMLCSKHI